MKKLIIGRMSKYVKVKAHLVNKNTGMLYETKNYKIHRKVWDRLVSQPI